MPTDLRPLTTGELIDKTVSLVYRNALLLAGIAAPPALLEAGLFLPLAGLHTPITNPPHLSSPWIAIFALASLAFMVLMLAATGACMWATARLYLGEPVSIPGSWRVALGRIPSLFGSMLLLVVIALGAELGVFLVAVALPFSARFLHIPKLVTILAVVILVIAACCAAVWAMLGVTLAQPAILVERLGPWQALRRSWRLASGGRKQILLFYLLLFMVISVAQFVVMIPLMVVLAAHAQPYSAPPAWLGILPVIFLAVYSLLFIPLVSAGSTMIYLNRRVICEAFDLQVRMPPPPPPPPETDNPGFPGMSPDSV